MINYSQIKHDCLQDSIIDTILTIHSILILLLPSKQALFMIKMEGSVKPQHNAHAAS